MDKHIFFDMVNLAESKIPTYRRNCSQRIWSQKQRLCTSQSKAKGSMSILHYQGSWLTLWTQNNALPQHVIFKASDKIRYIVEIKIMLIKNCFQKIKPLFTAILVLLGHSITKQTKAVAWSVCHNMYDLTSVLNTAYNWTCCTGATHICDYIHANLITTTKVMLNFAGFFLCLFEIKTSSCFAFYSICLHILPSRFISCHFHETCKIWGELMPS